MEAVEEPRSGVASREVRWSARRKEQVVLRLLRGESLDLLARETGRPVGSPAGGRNATATAPRSRRAITYVLRRPVRHDHPSGEPLPAGQYGMIILLANRCRRRE
jgi:hypothetical protein